ncbi:MAG: hypothetical protein ACYTG4_00095 [Planctomycetota bacterium]|jgi:hypothetical protein
MNVYLEGAMSDPITGLRDDENTTRVDLQTTGLGNTLEDSDPVDAIDGYKFWRFVIELLPPSAGSGMSELYKVEVTESIEE